MTLRSLVSSTGFGMFLLGAALALGFVTAADRVSNAMERIHSEQTIRVKGVAREDVVADRASWSGTVEVRGATLQEAHKELVRDLGRLEELVQRLGFPASAIARSPVDSDSIARRDERGNATNEVEAWRLSQSIELESPQVEAVRALALAAAELLGEGIQISSPAPRFTVSNLDDRKLRLLTAATGNARERAETLVRGGGARVGALISASQGVFQVTPRGSTEVSDYGENDTSSVEKTMQAVVTLEYAVAQR
jgi:hypothetical protein